MSVIQIRGLHGLKGNIKIQGSKNAVLPVMAASLLHNGTVMITNVPRIQDVYCMMGILESLGCNCRMEGHSLTIDTKGLSTAQIPEREAGQMRSSVMLLGPLLGRMGQAESFHPGGCSIGKRPIDLHLQALQALGADLLVEGGRIQAFAHRLKGTEILFPIPSVGATENALMAAVLAEGRTVIHGAAVEPEICILCEFLTAMGAEISGIGTATIEVQGRCSLQDVTFAVPGDRIVAGTYVGAVLAAGGDLILEGAPTDQMEAILLLAEQAGAGVQRLSDGVRVWIKKRAIPFSVETGPYPEFPTDLQSVMTAVAATASGVSRIQENVFEERFASAKELQKLGGHIIIKNNALLVRGRYPLRGAHVRAEDLRGGAALVVAGLAAEGETVVTGYRHIERGYEDICGDLRSCGADIRLG